MGKYDGILLCTDFDGTLYFEKNITAENIEAIRCFQENGGFFTVATGRFPSFIKEFEPSVKPNTHIIALNGSLIYDLQGQKALFEGFLPTPFEKYALKICREVQGIKSIILYRKENQCALEIKSEDIEYYKSYIDEKELYKVVLKVDKDASDKAFSHIESIVGEAYSVTRAILPESK